MVEDSDKEDEVKLEFDSAGQAIAYISLDQARVLALLSTPATIVSFMGGMPTRNLFGWN